MTYETITDEEKDFALVNQIIGRETEMNLYADAITSYQATLAQITDEWTPDLEQYRPYINDRELLAKNVPLEKIALMGRLALKEKITHDMKTSTISMNDVTLVYNGLKAQIAVDKFQAIVQQIRDAQAAAEAGK